ncbi:MAG: riboflavin biosynthesis protein RibF [Phycisphaerae bacterium]
MDLNRIHRLEYAPPELHGCVLTIGNFDGVHLGHRRILDTCKDLAEPKGAEVVALTFDPPPDLVLRPGDDPQRIDPLEEKANWLLEAGADHVVIATTDAMLMAMAPGEFIDQIIMRYFSPRHLVEGRNFFFGLGRSGNVDLLREAGAQRGYVLRVVDPVEKEIRGKTQRVSSTLVRLLVQTGRMEEAARCLARPFALYGRVIPGAGHGRILEFPTANIDPVGQVMPLDGVYAGLAEIDGMRSAAAVSIGTKPTLGPAPRVVEAYLLDASDDFYNRRMKLSLLKRIRDQERFDNADILKDQIAKDVARVREIYDQYPSL